MLENCSHCGELFDTVDLISLLSSWFQSVLCSPQIDLGGDFLQGPVYLNNDAFSTYGAC